jgi:hypothetical protein
VTRGFGRTRCRGWGIDPRATIAAIGIALVLAASLAISTTGAASQLRQAPSARVVYTLNGVTFDDGGTLTGSFVFDPSVPCVSGSCTAYSAVNLRSSVGAGCFVGVTYSVGLQHHDGPENPCVRAS